MSVIYGIRTFVPRMLAHGEPGHVVNHLLDERR